MSTIFKTIKLFEEEQAQTNTSTYMQVKTLVDKMDKGGKKRVADALKKSLGVVTEGVEPQQQLQQLQQQQYSMEAVVNQVRQATRAIKHDDTIHNIIVEIRQLAEKAGIDASELRYSENQVSEAFNQLASEVYGLEEAFTDKLSDIQNQVEELEYQLENPDEELDEAGSWKQQAAIAIAMKNKGKKPKSEGVVEGSQRVDSLVTDSLKIMRGSEVSDAVQALKTVLGNREYNERRGFYNFYVRQLMDMYGQKGLAEDHRDNPMYGQDADFDNMLLRREAKRKGMTVAQYKNYLEKQKQDQDHELNIGSTGRAELKQKADELAEIKREKLRSERLHDEQVAFQRAETVQQRKDEMQKIAEKYKHDLTVIDKEHRNNMEAIRTGNSHETNKMSMEFQHEKEMWDRNNPQQKPQFNPEKPIPKPEQEPNNDNFDQDTGEPLKPGFTRPQQRPQQSNQWHTSQQVGYKPTKPTKPNNNDIVDIEPKPNKPLALREKITVVRDPAQATGIQQTGGITHGSVYSSGKPLPQSLQQKLDGKPNTSRAVDDKGRTQQQWVKLVKAKFPDAKIMQSKMLDGPCFAMLSDGRKLSWNKVEQGIDEEKQRLDPKCWTGKHKEGTKMKGGVRVNNCVPNESSIMRGIKV